MSPLQPIDILQQDESPVEEYESAGSPWWGLVTLLIVLAVLLIVAVVVPFDEAPSQPQQPPPTEGRAQPGV